MDKFLDYLEHHAKAIAMGIALTIGLFFAKPFVEMLHWRTLVFNGRFVVRITNGSGSGGTGFLVNDSGKRFILTNAHVCGLAENGYLLIGYDGSLYALKVLKKYEMNDLCAIEPIPGERAGMSIASYVELHQRVYVTGHPLLEPLSVTEGEISSLIKIQISVKTNPKPEECSGPTYTIVPADNPFAILAGIDTICVRTLRSFSMTNQILPGNSGSPVINFFGNVVAVVFAGNGTRAYAVPLDDIKAFIREI